MCFMDTSCERLPERFIFFTKRCSSEISSWSIKLFTFAYLNPYSQCLSYWYMIRHYFSNRDVVGKTQVNLYFSFFPSDQMQLKEENEGVNERRIRMRNIVIS